MNTKPDSMTQARVWLQRACLRPAGSISCVCLLCLSLFLAGTPVWAQQSVTGRVVDDRTGEPVPYATVYVSQSNGTLTNEEGRFQLTLEPADSVTVSFLGYAKRRFLARDLPRVVRLESAATQMREVTVVSPASILNKVVKGLAAGGEFPSHMLKGVHLTVSPADAKWIRYDIIRSFDRPLLNADVLTKVDISLVTELDWQLFQLQRRYLDYQVNIGNRIISVLQQGGCDGAAEAQRISEPKKKFQDMIDRLFADTGKKIVRTENEIRFTQIGETLLPYQLSSGEKQILAILLTVLVEDNKPYVLFMDEPEVSLHVDWQQQLIDLILELNPNVQIILTTHSPAVIMNGWMDRVTEISDIIVNNG